MCQHRKSELMYFLSVINSGVNLPHKAVMWSYVIAQGVYAGPWVPVLGQTILVARSAAAWTSEKALSYLSHLHISWHLAFQQQDLLVSVSPWDWSWSPLFEEGCTTQEALLKIILHGKIVCNSIFQLSGNNSEDGRRCSQKKVVRRKVYMILQ